MKYILYHMPKTGGISINKSFKKHLKFHEELIHLSNHGNLIARRIGLLPWEKRSQEERNKAILVMGHSVNKDTQLLFKTNQKARHMVVFREPAKLIASLYNFTYQYKSVALPFALWCFWLRLKGLRNWQATVFYRHYLKRDYLSSYLLHDFNYFKNILDSFWYVGVTERINEDFKELAKFIGISNFEMETVNVSGSGDKIKHLQLTESLRNKLNNENKLDFQLYKYALNRVCPKYLS
ncbi:hypothetical protein ACFL2E_12445 [Thermodesulfobacteriota bacterium]